MGSQRRLFEALKKTDKPIILVLNTGSAMDISKEEGSCSAILQCWYSGECGGEALGDLLFGKVSPSGKLPVTVSYEGDLPEFTDYSMKGRTYRYSAKKPLYPFGYGLSYNTVEYSGLELRSCESTDDVLAELKIKNMGDMIQDEIVQIYISNREAVKDCGMDENEQPFYSLCAFEHVCLEPKEEKKVKILIPAAAFDTVTENGERVRLKGKYRIFAGTQQPDERSAELTGKKCLAGLYEIV